MVLYNAVPLGNQITSTMTWCPTQSYYPGTEPTSTCPILMMLSTRLRSDKYQFESHWLDLTRIQTCEVGIPRFPPTGDGRSTYSAITSGLPPHEMVYIMRSSSVDCTWMQCSLVCSMCNCSSNVFVWYLEYVHELYCDTDSYRFIHDLRWKIQIAIQKDMVWLPHHHLVRWGGLSTQQPSNHWSYRIALYHTVINKLVFFCNYYKTAEPAFIDARLCYRYGAKLYLYMCTYGHKGNASVLRQHYFVEESILQNILDDHNGL